MSSERLLFVCLFVFLPHETWRMQVGERLQLFFNKVKKLEKKNKERKSQKYGSQKSGGFFYNNS